MNIIVGEPKTRRAQSKRSGKYSELFAKLIERPGESVSVALDEVTGADQYDKQSTIHGAARSRKCKVETTVQDGRIYMRLQTTTHIFDRFAIPPARVSPRV